MAATAAATVCCTSPMSETASRARSGNGVGRRPLPGAKQPETGKIACHRDNQPNARDAGGHSSRHGKTAGGEQGHPETHRAVEAEMRYQPRGH